MNVSVRFNHSLLFCLHITPKEHVSTPNHALCIVAVHLYHYIYNLIVYLIHMLGYLLVHFNTSVHVCVCCEAVCVCVWVCACVCVCVCSCEIVGVSKCV